MQQKDLAIITLFIDRNMANFIEHCKEYDLSEFEADRIFDELEEQTNE